MGDGEVGGGGVADVVADVVRERADGEGKLIRVAGVAKEVDDEVAGADVVGEVREAGVAEGVVADVLDDAAAVRVGAGVLDFRGCERGVAAEQERDDGASPGEVDELLMGEHGVRSRRGARSRARQDEGKQRCEGG